MGCLYGMFSNVLKYNSYFSLLFTAPVTTTAVVRVIFSFALQQIKMIYKLNVNDGNTTIKTFPIMLKTGLLILQKKNDLLYLLFI